MKICLKKLSYLFYSLPLLLLFLLPHLSLASISFDLPSPQVPGTFVTPTCSLGNYFIYFNYTIGNSDSGNPCDGTYTFTNLFDHSPYGVLAEFDTTVPGSVANTTGYGDYTTAITDPGYISTSSVYTFPSGVLASCSSDECSSLLLILTLYLPRILILLFFPLLVIGIAVRFMRNPE